MNVKIIKKLIIMLSVMNHLFHSIQKKITQYFQIRNVSIEDYFEYKYNRLYKSTIFCQKCKNIEENRSYDIIFVPPKILVLILYKGHGKSISGTVKFNSILDLEGLIDK